MCLVAAGVNGGKAHYLLAEMTLQPSLGVPAPDAARRKKAGESPTPFPIRPPTFFFENNGSAPFIFQTYCRP